MINTKNSYITFPLGLMAFLLIYFSVSYLGWYLKPLEFLYEYYDIRITVWHIVSFFNGIVSIALFLSLLLLTYGAFKFLSFFGEFVIDVFNIYYSKNKKLAK